MPLQQGYVESLFTYLVDGRVERFFEHLDPEVRWTVMGSHVFAGTYHGRDAVRQSSFLPILNDLDGRADVHLHAVHVDGELAVVEFETVPREGSEKPCSMAYCWVAEFQGDRIVEVRAYPDPAMIHYLMHNDG